MNAKMATHATPDWSGERSGPNGLPFGGDRFARRSHALLLLLAAVVFFMMMRWFLVPVVLAAVMSGLFFPLHSWLVKRLGGRRSLSALLCCAALSLGLLLPAFVIADLSGREAVRLCRDAGPQIRSLMEGGLLSRPQIGWLQPGEAPLRHLVEHLAQDGSQRISAIATAVSRGTIGLIGTLAITYFTMYFFFRDGPEVMSRIRDLSPLSETHLDEIIRRFLAVSRATVKGSLLIALVKGSLGGLTFWAFGIPSPLLWGVAMVFLSILPILGPWLVMYPAALALYMGGHPWQAAALFLIATFVVGLVDNILQPALVGRETGMPELLIFFSTVGGMGLFGVTGFIVGPVVAALFLTLVEIYRREFRQHLAFVHHASGAAGIPESAPVVSDEAAPSIANNI